MTGPVLYEFNQSLIGSTFWEQPIQDFTDSHHQLNVLKLVSGADIEGLIALVCANDLYQGITMIFHMDPIPDVLPVPIDRYRISLESRFNYHRYEFFRILEGAIVIRTVGQGDRKPIGMLVGSYQVIC
jgi:hypothetical protein